MRVLVLNEKRSERDAIVRALPQDSYRVEAVQDERAALAAITREVPHFVIFSVPGKGGVDLVGRLRGADASGEAFLIALLEATPASRELSALLAAGVHDFVRRPLLETDVLERVKAPIRVARWARAVASPAAFGLTAALDVTCLEAWRNLPAHVASDLAATLGSGLTISRGARPSAKRRATIAMALVDERLEVRVSIAVDLVTERWLAENLLGDAAASDGALDDCLRELTNMAGGAFKRAALAENVTFTTGIPHSQHSACHQSACEAWTLSLNEEIHVCVLVDIHRLTNQRLAAVELAEGMILAHDVRNDAGVLLIAAGARLTSTSATQLARVLGPRFYLEVAPL